MYSIIIYIYHNGINSLKRINLYSNLSFKLRYNFINSTMNNDTWIFFVKPVKSYWHSFLFLLSTLHFLGTYIIGIGIVLIVLLMSESKLPVKYSFFLKIITRPRIVKTASPSSSPEPENHPQNTRKYTSFTNSLEKQFV